MRHTAIIYYSRSGTARMAAERLSAYCDLPVHEVRDRVPRVGLAGDLRCVLDAWLRRSPAYDYAGPPLEALARVVIVAPVWMRTLAAPMRAFLRDQAPLRAELSLVLVMSGDGGERAAADAAAAGGRLPGCVVMLRQYDVLAGECDEAFDALSGRLACRA